MGTADERLHTFRVALREAIQESPYTYRSLAAEFGVSMQTVVSWSSDRGNRNPPHTDVVFRLEDILGCPGVLSGALGYRAADFIISTESMIATDPELTPDQRVDLAAMYLRMRTTASARRLRKTGRPD
jgi:transcriptional regulator with XRE-family HTH domain